MSVHAYGYYHVHDNQNPTNEMWVATGFVVDTAAGYQIAIDYGDAIVIDCRTTPAAIRRHTIAGVGGDRYACIMGEGMVDCRHIDTLSTGEEVYVID